MYLQFPKPPIPLVSARECVVTFWNDESFGEGQRLSVGRSTTKEGAPTNSSNQLAGVGCFAAIVEAEGSGCKLTEVRDIDFAGGMLAALIDKASKNIPAGNFGHWTKKLSA